MDSDIETLSNTLVGEIFKALGLAEHGRARRWFGPLFRSATERLSRIGVTFDRLCAAEGLHQAADWALTNWCTGIQTRGVEHIPAGQPLLVISNHPGAYDALVIISRLKREDLRLIASDIPFLKYLPHARDHFLFVDSNTQVRASATRMGLRHLENGGALLLYGSGQIDPDPALFAEAPLHVDHWSRSIGLFLKRVPETRVVLSVVSHIVSRRWARSPLVWFRRQPIDKRRLVEFGQVIQQLLFPGSFYISPRLSFATLSRAADLQSETRSPDLLAGLVAREKELMAEHIAAFGTLIPGSALEP